MIIRHLVLPRETANSENTLRWIKDNIPECLLSLMFQFQPYFKSADYPKIDRRVSRNEYIHLKKMVENLNLKGWIQDHETAEELAGEHFQESVEDFLREI